ncbi:MAG: hypothetical protein H6814_03055 [Phycisphaeraceae bacterium]|nr:hypothetical protein [Phycisphaeraceae bacterium]
MQNRNTVGVSIFAVMTLGAASAPCLAGGCPADLNGDQIVDSADFGILFGSYGATGPGLLADLDGDELVGQSDLGMLLAVIGSQDCQNIAGPGGGVINAARVDTSTVRLGEDSLSPAYDGGVTHFCFEISTDVLGDDRWTTSAIHIVLDPGAPFELYHYPPPFGGVTVNDGFAFAAPSVIYATAVRSLYGGAAYDHDTVVTDPDEFFVDPWFTKFPDEHTSGLIARIGLFKTGSASDPVIVPSGSCPAATHIGTVVLTTTYASTEGQIFTNTYDIIQDPFVGDINGDLTVDTADLGLLLGHFGGDHPYSDLNNDGVVDTADLGLLLGEFGMSCP